MYIPGIPLAAHGVGPTDTTPVIYQVTPVRLLIACTINGPPLSPLQESLFLSPPAHICLLPSLIPNGLYLFAHLEESTNGTCNFNFTGLVRSRSKNSFSYMIYCGWLKLAAICVFLFNFFVISMWIEIYMHIMKNL